MRVLTISSERSEIARGSRVADRLIGYGEIVERYDVVLTGERAGQLDISARVRLYYTGGKSSVVRLVRLIVLARKVLSGGMYDVVSTKDAYYLGFFTWILANRKGAAFQVQIHGFEKLYPHRRMLAHFVLHRANGIRTVSSRLKKQLVDEFGVDSSRITVVPVYVDVSSIQNKMRSLGPRSPSATFRFLTVGRLVPIKNITLQIKALASLSAQYPHAHLTIAGDGPLRQKLEDFAAEHAVSPMVTFCGRADEIVKLFHEADCFVLSSWREGYGMAPIEAAAAGLPVIMTDVGCAGEVIRDGENGLVTPVGDAEKLSKAMARVMDDEVLRKRFIASNEHIGERLPSLSEILETYRAAWEGAVRAHRAHI